MTLKFQHILASVIIFGVLTSLILSGYNALVDEYGLTPTATVDGLTVMEKLDNLNVIGGMEDISIAISDITNPTSSNFDILGAFLSVGIGILKTAAGVITFPIEVFGVLTGFYTIPPIVSGAIAIIFSIYIGFIIVDRITRA